MLTNASTTVAIAGITGSLGWLIAEYLLAKPNIHVHGLCRTPSKLPSQLRNKPHLTIHTTSSTYITALRAAVHGAHVVICCYLGPSSLMVDGQKLLIDACIAEGVPRYIAGDWSMDFRKLEFGQHPPKDPMKLMQAYLEEREVEGRIKAVHVLNACFLERPWVGMWDAKGHLFKYWGTGDERWEFTTYRNAAQFTAEIAVDQDAVGWFSCKSLTMQYTSLVFFNPVLYAYSSPLKLLQSLNCRLIIYLAVCGDHVNIKEIAAAFRDVYGEEPGLVRLGSLEDLYKLMHEIRNQNPHNTMAWLGPTRIIRLTTALPLTLDKDRYPAVKLVTVRDFFRQTPRERIGRFGILQPGGK